MRAFSFVIIALLTVLALAGCGQKGPLYLPDESPKPEEEKRR